MSINVNDKNLGHATAYAYYKAGGGTMTEAEFTEFMADFGTASQTAVEAAQAALASETAAQTAATTATNKATEATTAATTATTKAGEASTSASTATSAKDTAVSASQTATTKATEATTAAATATSAKTDAVAANTAAQSAKTAAQTAQTGAETAAASVSASAAQIATNAEDISQLKSDLNDVNAELADVRVGADGTTYNSAGAAVRGQISNLKSDLITSVTPSSYHDGYIGSDGSAVTNTTDYQYCDYIKLPFPSDLKIKLNVSMISTKGVAFYDKYKGFISAINGNNCSDYGYTANAIPQEINVFVPSNAVYVRSTIRTPYVSTVNDFAITGNNYGDIIDRLDTLDDLLSYSPTLSWENKIVNARNGVVSDQNAYRLSNVFSLYKGQTITFRANGNGNNVTSILSKWSADGSFIGSIKTSTGNLYEDVSYTAVDSLEYLRICYYALSSMPIPTITALSTDDVMELLPMFTGETVYISVGNGKDYTDLVAAIESITDSSEKKQYVIYLYEGTYNTIVSADIDDSYVGLIIPDYVSIVGIGNRDSIIINGELPSGSESYANNISTINFMANGRIENVTIKAKNLRYCNHDDNILFVNAKHEYVRCKFVMEAVDSGISVAGSCVGIGSQKNKEVVFDNCTFENANTANSRACIIAHDYNGEVGMRMILNNCKMTGGQYNIRIGNNVANNPLQSFVVLNGNIFNKPLRVEANGTVTTNCFNFRGFGNKDLTLSLGGNLTDISDDYDVIEMS